MKLKLFILSALFLFPVFMFSQLVSEKKANEVAKNFLFEKLNQKEKTVYTEIELNLLNTKKTSENFSYRVYEIIGRTGFIIVSGDERLYPILGYSFESNFPSVKEMPENFEEWMTGYPLQIEYADNQHIKSVNPAWNEYSTIPDIRSKSSSKAVAPLLPCNWNQGCGYNALCPADAAGSCGHVYTGCVATAMAQVMKFHEHPSKGFGSHSYTHYIYGLQSVDFSAATYDWSIMSNTSGNAEVAELMYHCGVSVNMNYSPTGSGAYTSNVSKAYKNYFDYSLNNLFTYKSGYTDENWVKLLKAEIDADRPLVYQGYRPGSGHAFNLDGYDDTDHFHVNWGWGGSSNGYFYLTELLGFTSSQACIVGVIPKADYPGINCSSPIVLTCNTPYAGTTTTSQNIVNKYGSSYYQSTGKEVIHQITTAFPGRLRASITDLNGNNLDVFILNDCDQDSLIAYGDSTAIADNTVPGTYFIVVDGRNAYEGNYTLTVTCPTIDPDLILTNQTVSPMYIEAGGTANVSFKIKNIGNSIAGASKVNIYYSNDAVYDGSDIYIDQFLISTLAVNEEQSHARNILIPGTAMVGYRYIFFIADAENDVVESDELYNKAFSGFQVPDAGTMDCSVSIPLTSGVWYTSNTEIEGEANIETYTCGMYPAKEIIHSITATNNGVATFEFSEKVPGRMYLIPLSTCNENTCMMNYAIWNPEDTMLHESINVFKGITYYFIVDGEAGVSGNYALKVNMPGICPDPYISHWDEIDLCDSRGGVSLFTDWNNDSVQWYMNDLPIEGQTFTNIWADVTGSYKVKVTENGCSAFSDVLNVRLSPEPDEASLSALGDTVFCEGNDVTLSITTGTGNTIQWMKNGDAITGETGLNFSATESGIYSAKVTNISCTIESETIEIIAKQIASDIGMKARVNNKDLVSHFSCDINDRYDLSGKGNEYFYSGWTFPDDRFGKWNKSHYYNGQWEQTTTTNSFDNPNEFTLSLWFKTSTTKGGMLIGLADNQWGESTTCDRMIYMDDFGKLYFGVIDGTAKTVSTTDAYNDDTWHLLTTSLSPFGMKLYVDGNLKAEDAAITKGADYIGWWKLAYDKIDAAFPNAPSSYYYRGQIDEVRIYERALLAAEISYIFNEHLVVESDVDNLSHCETGNSTIRLINSDALINYQLRNDADNSPVGFSVVGNADDIQFFTGELSETTSFNISATNPENGCSMELNEIFTIEINDLPTVNLGIDFTMNTAQNETLEAGAGFKHYLWSDASIDQTLFLQGSVLGIGLHEFWVKVEDYNTCENADTIFVTVEESTNIDRINLGQIKIFPNPTSGIVKIDMNESSVIKDIKITDEFGRLMQHIPTEGKSYIEFNFTNRSKGIYFIHIQTEKGMSVKKIVLQ